MALCQLVSCQLDKLEPFMRGKLHWEMSPSHWLWCIVLTDECRRLAQLTVGSVTPELVVLDAIRNHQETTPCTPGSCLQVLPWLPWTMDEKPEEINPFLPKLLLVMVSYHRNRNPNKGAGEIAQWLRALTGLPGVLSSIPSNHMVAHNHL